MSVGRLVIDASVAVKWLVHEPGSEAAREAAAGADELLAPTFILVEAANALGKRVRLGALGEESARSAWRELLDTPLILVAVELELVEDAMELGLRLRHPVQDCLYLALALHREARVLTADRKFGEAAHRLAELRDKVLLLGR